VVPLTSVSGHVSTSGHAESEGSPWRAGGGGSLPLKHKQTVMLLCVQLGKQAGGVFSLGHTGARSET
jgi:hypothetical protein